MHERMTTDSVSFMYELNCIDLLFIIKTALACSKRNYANISISLKNCVRLNRLFAYIDRILKSKVRLLKSIKDRILKPKNGQLKSKNGLLKYKDRL